jgi:hypothetical protein
MLLVLTGCGFPRRTGNDAMYVVRWVKKNTQDVRVANRHLWYRHRRRDSTIFLPQARERTSAVPTIVVRVEGSRFGVQGSKVIVGDAASAAAFSSGWDFKLRGFLREAQSWMGTSTYRQMGSFADCIHPGLRYHGSEHSGCIRHGLFDDNGTLRLRPFKQKPPQRQHPQSV